MNHAFRTRSSSDLPGLRIERADITQSGDSPLQRGFTYAKPRLALRWDAGEADEWRLSLSREVGQLDFNDFVASASLDGGEVSAGNAELEPAKTWRATLRSEEHTSELQSLMRNSYAVFCLKKKNKTNHVQTDIT